MENYSDFDTEFIERTLALIEQYNGIIEDKPFSEQYNYTLALNHCAGPQSCVFTFGGYVHPYYQPVSELSEV
ncbi:hypothetical protein ABM280_004655 [Salmonella enterica]